MYKNCMECVSLNCPAIIKSQMEILMNNIPFVRTLSAIDKFPFILDNSFPFDQSHSLLELSCFYILLIQNCYNSQGKIVNLISNLKHRAKNNL